MDSTIDPRIDAYNNIFLGFNSNGGGVYASMSLQNMALLITKIDILVLVHWSNDGISVYFFPRGSIPSDIQNGAPTPDSWGTPMAHWSSKTCDIAKFFKSHWVLINTTLWYVFFLLFSFWENYRNY